ncbi:MAG: DNA-processing protein DprA [Burkholderiales bacterium]|nr:MAG: DNA-processing protein DprA [Burkholderiales bacterium]
MSSEPPIDSAPAEELRQWLRLCLSAGAGPVAVQQMLRAFGPPEAVLEQPESRLAAAVGGRLAAGVRHADPRRDAAVEQALAWAAMPGHAILTLADPRYPSILLRTPDPPPLLYVDGDAALLGRPMLAVVGSRNATAQGRDTARAFSRALAEAGFTIVSGLALGIDAAAHEAALATAAGTVAVLGTGIDLWYPPANRPLAASLSDHGCLVSEMPPATPATPGMFPRRNRIIAGLAAGVLVVEAARRSGALITARQAAELGREVFAVPGSIHSPMAKGCHQLIREGARLVESAQEILQELQWTSHGAACGRPGQARTGADDRASLQPDPVLDALGFDPAVRDTLCARSRQPAATVAAQLASAELDGIVERLADGRWARRR